VIEAGLGGRYDATNVLGAEVVVLTNVGLEHTRWLGPTIADIAGEKLAVVRPGATLVLGDDHPDVVRLAQATGAKIVPPASAGIDAPGYQRKNLGAAVAAAKAILGHAISPTQISLLVPGRLQVVDQRPLTIYDGAHNAPGIAALAESVPQGTVAVLSVLDDKDAAAMLKALLPRLSAAVFTRAPNPRALSPATLADLAKKVGSDLPSEIEPDPRKAVSRARELAGESGTVLATGSIYLVAELLSAPGERRASAL
jgi:dihydrofolate synthase / folylpolyglutamate synthase